MTNRIPRASRHALLFAAVVALACDARDDAPKVSLARARADSAHAVAGVSVAPALSAEARAALDSGNALFRKEAYAQALAQYRLASGRAPGHAAPYFGINMVAQATGNKALADSALAWIRANGAEPAAASFDHSDSALNKGRSGARKGPIS